MYKYLKLSVDILFLIISVAILVYFYSMIHSRPVCEYGKAVPVVPKMAWVAEKPAWLVPAKFSKIARGGSLS